MSIVIDLIVIGLIALFTFLGYKQGLVKAAIKILSFFIAIIVALSIYKPVSGIIIKNTFIDDNIKSAIVEKIGVENEDGSQEIELDNKLTSKIVGEVNTTIDGVATAFSIKLIETVTLLGIFILIKIALKFITILTDLITKLPLIKQVNKLRGNIIWISKRDYNCTCYIGSYLSGISIDKTGTIKVY